MSEITKDQVLAVLAKHIGAGKGVTASELAEALGTHARRLRTCISDLREDGIAVCGHPASGYYIAANDEELEATCEFLHSRALHSLRLESRLRRIPLPDLIGQLKLRT